MPLNGTFEVSPTAVTPGSCARLVDQPLPERAPRRRVGVARRAAATICAVSTFSVENPGSTLLQAREALDQQPGADQQHQRERHLGDDQRRAHEAGAAARRAARRCRPSAATPVLPRMTAIAGTRPKTRPVTTASASVNSEHRRVQRRIGAARELRGAHRDQRADAGQPERQPADARRAATSTTPSVSICRTSRHCPAPSVVRIASSRYAAGRAHQQQVRDVDAGDQQHDEHARLQHVERRPHVADQLLADRTRVAAEAARASRTSAHCGSRSRLRSTIVFICALSCSIVAPGRSRAIIELNSLPRPWSDICCGVNANGTSAAMSRAGSSKSAGSTPTTAIGLAVQPDVAADDRGDRAPNRDCPDAVA